MNTRNPKRTGTLILLLGLFVHPELARPGAAAAGREAAGRTAAEPLSLLGWTVADPCGSVTEPVEGFLSLSYRSPDGAPVDLTPPEPLTLPADVTRLRLWFAETDGQAKLTWLIRDGAGALHEIEPRRSSFYNGMLLRSQPAQGRFQWPLWTQTESSWLGFPGEAEVRRRLPEEEVGDALARIWPRPLTLAGIRITPVHTRHFWLQRFEDKPAPVEGTLWLTGLAADRTDSFGANFYSVLRERERWARGDAQRLFPDDLVDGTGRGAVSGPLRWEIAVRRGYQGPELWTAAGEGDLDRDDPVGLFQQAIALPKVAPGRYWVRTKAWRPDGTLAATRRFQWFVLEGPETHPDTGRSDPWTTGCPRHVFGPDTRKAALTFTPREPAGPLPEGAQWTVTVMDYQRNTVLEQPLTPDADGQTTVACPVRPGFDYFAAAELRAGGKVLDREPLHFGVANGPETPGAIPDSIPDFQEWFRGNARINPEYGYGNNTAFTYPFTIFGDFGLDDFRTWLEPVLKMGTDTISFTVYWDQVELLPGVFRWDLYDRMLEVLQGHGLRAYLFYSHGAPPMRVPVWVDDLTLMRDQFGDVRSTSSASAWCPAHRGGLADFLRTRAEHYRDHPAVAGYILKNTSLNPPRGGLLEGHPDFSAPARNAFAAWLADRGRDP
ncbi:MAG: beta-galactosidase, partial [Lentisphaerae bacterium]|nr:beta-galactosidase [Lentisphaerota bacterium]